MSPALAQSTAKVQVWPVDHFVGARFSRRTWRAYLAHRQDEAPQDGTGCPHVGGHKTTAAAIKCGKRMWAALPVEVTA